MFGIAGSRSRLAASMVCIAACLAGCANESPETVSPNPLAPVSEVSFEPAPAPTPAAESPAPAQNGAPAPAAGLLQFIAPIYSISENGGVAQITLTRTQGSAGPASVTIAVAGGTAKLGEDYTIASPVLNWSHGDSAPQTVAITVINDALDEPDETLLLNLSDATGATLGDPITASITLLDDDLPPPVARVYQQLTFEPNLEHTEPDVRVDPADANHVLVSWMQRSGGAADLNNCVVATTFDGGATWRRHLFTKLAHVACADISMAFAPFTPPERGPGRTVYATSIGYGAPGGVGDGDGASNYEPKKGLTGQVYLFRSDDGGLTWSEPTVVYDWADRRAPAAFDRPWIVVDESFGPFRGRIYVSAMTVFVQQAAPRVYLKYSDDGGATFSAPIEADRSAGDAARSTAFATLAVGGDGRVMMVYRSFATGIADDQPGEDGNLADRVLDAGAPQNQNGVGHVGERSGEGYCIACFSAASIQFKADSLNPNPDADFALMPEAQRPYAITWSGLPFVVSGAPRNSEENPTFATVAADRVTPGRFAAVFVESRYSKEAQASDYHHIAPGHTAITNPAVDLDISFTWSDDWGAHWSRPVRVNNDPIGSGVIQDRVWITFDPGSGLPVVAWRDRRNSLEPQGIGNGVMTDLYAARLEAFGRRDWGDAPQSVSQPETLNARRYGDAPKFGANQRLSSPLEGRHGGGHTSRSSLSDSFFSVAVANNSPPSGRTKIWLVWAPILITRGNNTAPDEVDLESGLRQIMLRIWDPEAPIDLTAVVPQSTAP